MVLTIASISTVLWRSIYNIYDDFSFAEPYVRIAEEEQKRRLAVVLRTRFPVEVRARQGDAPKFVCLIGGVATILSPWSFAAGDCHRL
jgi:hypothetical protein